MSKKRSSGIFAVLFLIALIAVTSALVGCGGTTTTTAAPPADTGTTAGPTTTAGAEPTTSEATGQNGFQFGYSSPVASNQYIIAINKGQNVAADALGDKVQQNDANLSPDKQVADIDSFVTMKVKGIISWTLDEGAATAAYARAQAAGIPVVSENSPGQSVNTWTVTEDKMTRNSQIDAAKYIAERIPGAKFLVIGSQTTNYIRYTSQNMIDEGKKAGLTFLERQDNLIDVASGAQQVVQDLLTKYPDTQAIWCYNDPSALGASAAVRAAGKKVWNEGGDKSGVIIIGMNGAPDAIDAIKNGYQTATYDTTPNQWGQVEVELLDRVASGKMAVADMPKVLMFKSTRIDATNLDKWVDPNNASYDAGLLDKMLNDPSATDPAVLDDYFAYVKTLK